MGILKFLARLGESGATEGKIHPLIHKIAKLKKIELEQNPKLKKLGKWLEVYRLDCSKKGVEAQA